MLRTWNSCLKISIPCGGGFQYLHHSSTSRKRRPKGTQCWGCNWATKFVWDINMGMWPSRLGSLESETVKYGHESRGTLTREWLCWRKPPAIINDRPILLSEIMLHKGYNRKSSVEKILLVRLKGLGAETNWLAVNRQSQSNSDFDSVLPKAEPSSPYWQYRQAHRSGKCVWLRLNN
jgi:hypothetical protein